MVPATDNLQATRRQLDDLEALVKKMLDLAGGEDTPSKEENLSSLGIFSEEEFLGKPKEKLPETWLPPSKQPEEFSSYQFIGPNPDKGTGVIAGINSNPVDIPNPKVDSSWKPSTLTWAPLAESWEKAKLPPGSNPNEGLESTPPSKEKKEGSASFFQQSLQTPGFTSENLRPEISPMPETVASKYPSQLKKKRRPKWRDLVGFLGIVFIAFAFVLVIMSY